VNPRRLDALIAGALFAGLTAETLTSSHLHGPVALNVLASAGASLPFAWRRVYPVAVVAVVITSAGLEAAFLTDFTDLTTALVVPLLAAYTLGEQLERRASYVALAATYVGAMAVEVIDHGSASSTPVVKGEALASDGHGLFLVEQLADSWGYVLDQVGTAVWFQLTG